MQIFHLVLISLFIVNLNCNIDLALSYDDVLLVPKKSLSSRGVVSTKTQLTKNISISIPIISANMDTVTEADMAIALAQVGGIGIIHRFNTIEDQVYEVQRVKRYRSAVIQNPITINKDLSIDAAIQKMQENHITSLLVVDENNNFAGILTSRDTRFFEGEKTKVSELMTPMSDVISADPSISIEQAQEIIKKNRIEKLPLISAEGKVCGLITSKDLLKKMEYPNASVDDKGRLLVGAAIGVGLDVYSRTKALLDAGVDVLVIDIAHGHSDSVADVIRNIKKNYPSIDIIAGNVATPEATKFLIEAGADAIKVGIGPGSICTTRITTGCGYPQLSAVMNCAKIADECGVPVIADGGVKVSGDITKAIAAGASTVMLGSLLAGTDESPGKTIVKGGKKFKVIRGMASFGAHLGRTARGAQKENKGEFIPEGVEALVPYKGAVADTIIQLIGGLKSGMSYCGTLTIEELRSKCTFIRITDNGLRESHPHDVQQI